MEDLGKRLVAAVVIGSVIGFFLAILWAMFWTVTVPSVFPGQVWAGHEALIVPVFALGFFAPLVALVMPLFSRR